jgi:hypothetical protein
MQESSCCIRGDDRIGQGLWSGVALGVDLLIAPFESGGDLLDGSGQLGMYLRKI